MGEMGEEASPHLTYRAAGVDLSAAESAVERIRDVVRSTDVPGVVSGIGGFGGVFDLLAAGLHEPLLVASTDGVGTKAVVAAEMASYDTIGIDLVAMCVDDLVCEGARPLFLLDYVAVGSISPGVVERLVAGVAEGCRQVGASLLGGEVAEHPGEMREGQFDLAGFAVGAVERGQRFLPERVVPGDVLLGISSPGLRCNGYALARAAFARAGRPFSSAAWRGANHSLGEELLRPSVLYAPAVLAAARGGAVHAAAHITGGGMEGNLSRVLPKSCDAVVELGSWDVPRIFQEVREAGFVTDDEMQSVFNMGVGLVLVIDPSRVNSVRAAVADFGHSTSLIGHISEGCGKVRLRGAISWPAD